MKKFLLLTTFLLLNSIFTKVANSQLISEIPACPSWDYELYPIYPNAKLVQHLADNQRGNPSELYVIDSTGKHVETKYSCFLELSTSAASDEILVWYQKHFEENGFKLSFKKNDPPVGDSSITKSSSIFMKENQTVIVIQVDENIYTGESGGLKAEPGGKNEITITVQSFAGDGTSSPAPVSTTNSCVLQGQEEEKRQEIFNELLTKFNLKVEDTTLCGETRTCVPSNLWSVKELSIIRDIFNELPSCFIDKLDITSLRGIRDTDVASNQEEARCCCKYCVNAIAFFTPDTRRITVCGNRLDLVIGLLDKGILVHELTHAFQFFGVKYEDLVYNTPNIIEWMEDFGWECDPLLGCQNKWLDLGKERQPVDWPKNPIEDMAETVRLYWSAASTLQKNYPAHYEFIKNQIMCGKEFTTSK